MLINAKDFRFVLCPGSMPEPSFQNLYNQIYQCWREVWTDAFKELNVKKFLNSDSFTRQDYVGAIFYKDQCVAMAFFRWATPERQEFFHDSYFKDWGPDHINTLCSRGPRIIVCSNFTVHKLGRGQSLGVSIKDLLSGMVMQTFLNSEADAMTGAVRIDRGVNKASLRWGAYSIAERVSCEYGEDHIELIGLFKDYVREQPKHELNDLAEAIWQDRIVVSRTNIEAQFLQEAKTRFKVAV